VTRLQLSAHLHGTDDSHRVTNLELFYDLVFVFALTQITHLIDTDPNAVHFGRGAVLLAMVWFSWTAYSWLGNQVRADVGLMRACMFAALIGMFFAAVAIPSSFDHGHAGAWLFVAAYVLVRGTHVTVYCIAAGEDTALRHQVLRSFSGTGVAAIFWFAGAAAHEQVRLWCWIVGWAIDFVAVYVTSRKPSWRLNAASHFAERFGLIVLIAIGESLISIGAPVSSRPITWHLVGGVLCGLLIAIALWWLYFDLVAHVAEHTLLSLTGVERVKLARDSFTYLHLAIVTGIVLTSLGLKFALTDHHAHGVGAWSLYGGMALYLLSLSALRRLNLGAWNVRRVAAAAILLVLAPLASHLDGLPQLALLAALVTALITAEQTLGRAVHAELSHE
jgi:low temperature requirement protein LtrA